MKSLAIGGTLRASEIALGCMRIHQLSVKEASVLLHTALEHGINFFDHADIYGQGQSEECFAKALGMNPAVRENLLIQTKCGIRPGLCYDFSKDHILRSVDGSLKRLKTEYIDVLLLHRPDTLMQPEEVAAAFDILHSSGKVRHFGVSNQNPLQMELLGRYLNQRLIADQLQFGPCHTGMVDGGIHVNMTDQAAVVRDGGVLEYCRLKDITIQPWSPFQHGFFDGIFLGNDHFAELNRVVGELAEKYGVPDTAVVTAWILRHPARMQPVVGTTNPARLADICRAAEICLTREEWYAVYMAAGNTLP